MLPKRIHLTKYKCSLGKVWRAAVVFKCVKSHCQTLDCYGNHCRMKPFWSIKRLKTFSLYLWLANLILLLFMYKNILVHPILLKCYRKKKKKNILQYFTILYTSHVTNSGCHSAVVIVACWSGFIFRRLRNFVKGVKYELMNRWITSDHVISRKVVQDILNFCCY